MTTKQDWTLAGFLYGLAIIACVGMAGYAIIMTSNFISSLNNGQPQVIQLPVEIESTQNMATVDAENSSINIYSIDELSGEIDISASDDSKRALVGFQLFKVVGWGVYFSIFFLLGRVFKSVKDGEPFHENNPKYFKYLGLILILAHIFSRGTKSFLPTRSLSSSAIPAAWK
jgi:hypothetical protein